MRVGTIAGVAAVAFLAAGCALVSPVAAPVVPTFSETTTTPPPTSSVPRPALPTSCRSLIDGRQLDNALGLPLSVVVQTRIGQPSPSVGLTGRVSCIYGIPSPSGGHALELSLTTYRDAAAAAARVPVNVEALSIPGVNPVPVAIGQLSGSYLALPDGPLLIASAGIYSVTVTLGPTSFVPGEAPSRAATVAAMVFSVVRA